MVRKILILAFSFAAIAATSAIIYGCGNGVGNSSVTIYGATS